jgi:bacterioferritin
MKGAFIMKGDPKLIETLNVLLADELTAINQYIVHAEMCEDWGYGKLHEGFEKRAIDEMKHAEKLIGRILFLGGSPIVSNLNGIHIGAEVPQQIENDRVAELGAIKSYNDAIILAGELRDYATRDILMQILNDEDSHMDELEELQDQIEQMTLPMFLTTQVG